jgi:hypothetical protein
LYKVFSHYGSRKDLLAALAICVLMFILYGGLLRADFLLKDDAAAVHFARGVDPMVEISDESILDLFWQYAIQGDLNLGRFRPTYWFFYIIEAKLMYPNTSAWYLETLIGAYIACLFFYMALRQIEFSVAAALVATIPIVLAGMYVWHQLSLAEDTGILFASIAMWSLVKAARTGYLGWDILGIITLVLAGFSKETFTLLALPLLILRLYLEIDVHTPTRILQLLRMRCWLIMLWILIFGAMIGFSAVLLTEGGYGTAVVGQMSVAERLSPKLWWHMLLPTRLIFAYWFPALGLLLVIPSLLRASIWRWHIFVFSCVFTLWTIPQFVLYADAGFANSHYFFPTVYAFAVLNGAGAQLLIMRTPRIVSYGTLAIVCVLLLYRVPQNISFIGRHIAFTRASMEVIRISRQSLNEKRGNFIMVTEPLVNIPLSIEIFLADGLSYKPRMYFDPLDDGRYDPTWMASEANYVHARGLPTAIDIDIAEAQISTLAVFTAAEYYPPIAYDWFEASEWNAIPIVEPYTVINVKWIPPTLETVEQSFQFAVFINRSQ